MVTLEPIRSAQIHAIGYDPKAKELHIHFHGSKERTIFPHVPSEVYARFRAATSKLYFFLNEIKPHYPPVHAVSVDLMEGGSS